MRGQQMANLKPLPVGSVGDAFGHEPGQFLVVNLLQLAAAAFTEMATRRFLVMRTVQKRTIASQNITRCRSHGKPPISGDAVTLGSKANNQAGFEIGGFSHRQAA